MNSVVQEILRQVAHNMDTFNSRMREVVTELAISNKATISTQTVLLSIETQLRRIAAALERKPKVGKEKKHE